MDLTGQTHREVTVDMAWKIAGKRKAWQAVLVSPSKGGKLQSTGAAHESEREGGTASFDAAKRPSQGHTGMKASLSDVLNALLNLKSIMLTKEPHQVAKVAPPLEQPQ